ncbi:hypothetical protein CHLRE_16g685700v5 [Chlamydomonas reinhardtii]|uniref:Uncharacterized protein n=1 Tax=Chlamydomonas reinhardtii TaxID=3055 RepID=A8ISB6_CHLRE|nr:uncharacterized protein CHLRE_16g685700v5 [Chlamydomonas reinhardtii]PNW72021.1 hypothetical protein CHLRE_16g685700v5 [Chlamydomonas reinhardtii]|eukprot:XP_001692095.1 transmembrane protein of CMA family [Chlamydomonas reinhardtii]
MGCCTTICKNLFLGFVGLCKVGLSIAIIIIVAIHLQDYKFSGSGTNTTLTGSCLLSKDFTNQDYCNYAYAVCGISMCVSLAASLFLCITCNACGCGSWVEFILYLCQCAWWVIAACVFSRAAADANDVVGLNGQGLPQENWRTSVPVISWVISVLAFLAAIISLADAIKCCRDCCCSGDDSDKGKKEKKDKKAKTPPQPAYEPPKGQDPAVRANAV